MSLITAMQQRGIWESYVNQVAGLEPVLLDMSARGMPVEPATYAQVKATLTANMADAKRRMNEQVPDSIKKVTPYKRTPKVVTAAHFQVDVANTEGVVEKKWFKRGTWTPSNQGLIAYIRYKKHPVPTDYKTKKETTKALEIMRLSRATGDPLYKAVIDYRKAQTILKNHMKNWVPGDDSRVHSVFYFDPATGQLSSRRPNIQNAPKRNDPEFGGYADLFRSMIAARPGHIIVECVAPQTRVLRHNLTWDFAENLCVGDALWGFSENLILKGKRAHRPLCSTKVTNVARLYKPCLKITTDKGNVVCSVDHCWMRRTSAKPQWRRADQLKVGQTISYFVEPWTVDETRDGGWLAGILDGEGWGGNSGHRGLSFGQNDGLISSSATKKFAERGFTFERRGKRKCGLWQLTGQAFGWVRAIGSLRPVRLLEKAINDMEGMAHWGKNSSPARILSIEPVGEQEVIAIETTTHTFIAEGMLSHNCDFKSFHAQTLAFEAEDRDYLRLAKLDIHSFLAARLVREPRAEVCLSWPDAELAEYLKWIKKNHKFVRDEKAKRAILGYGFGMGWKKLYDMNRESFDDQRDAKRTLAVLDETFPVAKRWRDTIKQKAHDQGYLISRFGYIRYFWEVNTWKGGQWRSGGDHAEAAIAFLPANDAFGHMRHCMLEIRRLGLDERYGLINNVHDSLVFELPENLLDEAMRVREIMESPSKVLINSICPNGLAVEVDVQVGLNWAAYDAKNPSINPNGLTDYKDWKKR